MQNFYNRRSVEKKLKEKLKDDRARIQFGRISNFGLLEMTRQRLRESYVKWNMVLSLDSFASKIIKKAEESAFSNKAKIVNITIPHKVKTFIEENSMKEIDHFRKEYKLDLNIFADNNLIIPEYRIELLNKNKKIIKKIEHIQKIEKDSLRENFNKKKFFNKKFKNNFKSKGKFKKKFRYHSKTKRHEFENKKPNNY